MKWYRRWRARKRRDEFCRHIFVNKILYDPRIYVGDSAGRYLVEDKDTFCMWCGLNVTEGHAPWCDWLEMVKEWGQIQYELER